MNFATPLVLADAGTPLMWTSMLHLLVGNALIGVGEGLLLVRLFKTSANWTIPVMMAANYFSAWTGGLGLSLLVAAKFPRPSAKSGY
jgi:hypothetical protein